MIMKDLTLLRRITKRSVFMRHTHQALWQSTQHPGE
jgi:hypothetical protein